MLARPSIAVAAPQCVIIHQQLGGGEGGGGDEEAHPVRHHGASGTSRAETQGAQPQGNTEVRAEAQGAQPQGNTEVRAPHD